jgi:EAL domain-containing protein (putative c-di-GMP-specific phosphodiesterase class I)
MSSQIKRFISFAFAAADLLIEVGAAGEIRFALGAALTLTDQRDDSLRGRNWLDLFDPADHAAIQHMVEALGPRGRCGPLPVRMAATSVPERRNEPPRRAALSACRLAGPEEWLSCVLTALPASDGAEKPLADIEGFMAAASKAGEAGAELTLLDAPGLASLAQRDPALCQTVVQRINTVLRDAAVAENAATRLSETRFGVAHGNDASLRKGLAAITAEGARNGFDLGISAHNLDLSDKGLEPDELLQAVRFAVNRFSTMGADAALPGSATEAFEQMVDSAIERMNDFAEVVREEKFDLSFQPIVELASNALHHFEVLARFTDGSSPFEKVQFAEEIGVIEKFDFAVLTRSIAAIRAEDRRGIGAQPLRLAVNMSGKSLENALFIRLLLASLDDNRDLAGRLSLEVTESARLQDLARAERVIQEIRRRGFDVYIDDFGAGAASFQYLQALTVTGVKIDGSYVKRIGGSRRDDTLLRGLVRLCGDLEIITVGEMVETMEQGDFLRGIGVTLGQGWLFGKAAPTPVWASKLAPPPSAPRVRGRRQGATESWG